MRYSLTDFTTLALCLTCCATVGAGDPKRLTQACPRLAPIDGAPAGTTVIDNEMILRLAKKGRFAAITERPSSVMDSHSPKPPADAAEKRRWRTEHSRLVSAIQRIENQLTKALNDHKALKSQYFALSKEIQRIRLRPRMEAKAQQIDSLRKNLRGALDSFSRMIREARKAGAQPGWFRDLPRP